MIELRLLGGVKVSARGGQELGDVLSHPKHVALLAWLAAARPYGLHQRDSLVALLWSELDQAHARGALRKALQLLRQSVGADVIVSRGDDLIGVEEGRVWCDVRAFDAAIREGRHEEALDLYRGPLLRGMFVNGAPEFERWAEQERQHLWSAAVKTAGLAADAAEKQGDALACVEFLRRATQLTPGDEQSARRLMTLLARAGDRAGAVRVFEQLVRYLESELQLGPSPESVTLMAAIRSTASAPALSAVGAGAASRPGGGALQSDAASPPPPHAWTRRMSRRSLVATSVLVLGAATLLATRPGSHIVSVAPARLASVAVLVFANETGRSDLDFVGSEVQDWITRGLQQTGVARAFAAAPEAMTTLVSPGAALSLEDERRWATKLGVGTLVKGGYVLRGDSLQLHVSIIAAADGRVIASPDPVAGALRDPTPAIETLHKRVMGALAANLDPSLREWASFSSQPPSFEAYQELAAGLRASQRDDYTGAIRRYLRAADLDSSFVSPLLLAVAIRGQVKSSNFPSVDSILRRVRSQHPTLAPFDEALTSAQEAVRDGDFERAYEANLEVRRFVAPGSSWEVDAVASAVSLNKADAAMAIARTIDLHREAALDHWSVFVPIGNAYHLAGENAELLVRLDQEGPQSQQLPIVITFRMLALAALARPNEVAPLWRTLLHGEAAGHMGLLMSIASTGAAELRAHGARLAAIALAAEALDSFPVPPHSRNPFAPAPARMHLLREAGRDRDALRIARWLEASDPSEPHFASSLGALAARLGDTATARQMDERLSSWPPQGQQLAFVRIGRARIAASLGRHDLAVSLLHDACDHGCALMEDLHTQIDFDALRSFAPFQAILKPRP